MNKFGAQNMVSPLKKVLMKRPQNFMSKVDIKKWNYTSQLDQEILNENYNEFYKIIKNSGAEIVDLKLRNENEELCDSIFTHDPSLVLNDGAIILNMGKNLRKKEIEEHSNFYNEEKIPIIGKVINDGTVEGGDCLWINNKTLFVGESHRTNKIGIDQLDDIVKRHNVKLISTKLPSYNHENSCFHLMSLISMLDENLAIACVSLLTEDLSNLLKENKIEIIEMPEDEYLKSKTLSVNILALSPRNLVAMKGYPKTIDLLIKSGCEINLFSGNELCIKAEGGATCLTRPIWRE
jgi:N-dimethylarginine dimethylaminohydrolase